MSKETVERFIRANDKYPVVYGYAIGSGGRGAVYTLTRGQRFELDADDLAALPLEYPKWETPSQST